MKRCGYSFNGLAEFALKSGQKIKCPNSGFLKITRSN
jgi:hypothetical protein